MNRTNPPKLDSKVFNLASNLFGYGDAKEKQAICNDIAKAVAKDLQIDSRIMAVYPMINDEAFSLTMDNYRKFISAYNFRTTDENAQIQKYNTAVKKFRLENKLTEVQSNFSVLFVKNHIALSARKYNDKVDEFSINYGKIVEKKKIQTVKYSTEIIFQNLLHLYNSQLMKRNGQYMKLSVTAIRPIQEFKINSFFVTELKRNNVQSLDLCTKTVRNHRQRLEEAGVFVEYTFKGQNRAVEVHINTEILSVFDIKTNKMTIAENQRLNPNFEKLLPDNNEITGTILKEYQKKENASDFQVIRSSLSVTPSDLFYKNTSSKEQNKTEGGGPESVKVYETLSERLQSKIMHPQELAENLASKEYNAYRPIDIRILYKEAFSGTMTNDEFRELAIQDFFKSVSKIWKNSTPFVGSWKKAITLYQQNKWISFTGNSLNKSALVDDIQQMRWRIEWARKWFFKNKNINPLFPFQYFDVTRKTCKEIGFEYTLKKWNENLLALKKYDAVRKKQECDAVRRKETINHSKKCKTEINRFFKNKITMPQLFDYVEKNLPKEYFAKLPQMIEAETLKLYGKASEPIEKSDFANYNFLEF